jgi:hypothetical protein
VVSLSAQVMRFPSDLSAFLKLPAVSPRERQRILGDLSRPLFFNEDAAGHDSMICHAFGGKADIAPNRSHVLRYKNPHGLIGACHF